MEPPTKTVDDLNNLYSDDLLNLANNQVHEALSNALRSLVRIYSSPCISLAAGTRSSFQNMSISPINHSLQANVSIRCRSSSRNSRRERRVSFHHTIPRCSIPTSKNDLVQYRAYVSSIHPIDQVVKRRSTQHMTSNCSNRRFDVQYSFSLNKPWLTKIDKQRHNLMSIQNFVNELVEHSIRTALIQIDYQTLANNHLSIYEEDTSCLLFDCSPSYVPIERVQAVNAYVDRFVHLTIKESIENISSSNENYIEYLSNRVTEDAIKDALSTISVTEAYSKSLLTDDEKHSRKTKKRTVKPTLRLVNNENQESQTSLFQQIRHRSSSAFRTLTNNNIRRDTVDVIVNNLALKIYSDSFNELRQIYTRTNWK